MSLKFLSEIESGTKNAVLKKNIICYYINNGENTLADLGKEMNLSVPTVTKLVTELMEDGFVEDFGKVETNGGRRPNIYGLNHNSGYFVGVDIKRSLINIGLANFKGEIVHSQINIPFQVDRSPECFDAFCQLVNNYLDSLAIPREKILSVGLNISGRVNTETGHSYSFFYFDETPLTDRLKERLGIHVSIDNDTRAMTYGEFLNGCINAEKHVLYVNVSWGLGLGIIINGQLYYGKSGYSGEFGHFTAFDNEIICQCGKKGCLETEASGSYIHRRVHEKIEEGNSSILEKKLHKNGNISLEDIVQAAISEDMLAIELVEDVGNTLGKYIAGLINLFNPELVVIGGTLAETGDFLLLPIQSAINKYSLNLVNKDTKIKQSKLGDNAGIVGACLLTRSKMIGLI